MRGSEEIGSWVGISEVIFGSGIFLSLIHREGAPAGTAESCGEDFHQKILDPVVVHRKFLEILTS
jgi:hypothetical protein